MRIARLATACTGLLLFQTLAAPSNPGSSIDLNKPREIERAPANGARRSIRILTWNIDHGGELRTIASELERNPAGLCLLQEVDWNTNRTENTDVAGELARRLHLNLAYGIEFEELSQESGRPAFTGQATLTDLPIRHSRVLRFQTQSGFWKPRSWIPSSLPLMQRRLGSRMALVTDLDFAGRLFVVYNAHLESRSMGRIQSAQLDEILADLKRYPPDTAAVIGGDLNTKYFASAYLKKLERQGFHSCTGERIERTHMIAMALDWIFVRGPVKIEDGKVRKDFSGSDHYPVYARVSAQ